MNDETRGPGSWAKIALCAVPSLIASIQTALDVAMLEINRLGPHTDPQDIGQLMAIRKLLNGITPFIEPAVNLAKNFSVPTELDEAEVPQEANRAIAMSHAGAESKTQKILRDWDNT